MFTDLADLFLDAVAGVLAFFYSLPVVGGNYGLAIIMLTLLIMIVLMPLTLKGTRSTIKMAQMQPQLKAIQKKYKGETDRMAMNAEVMALYKENNISPVGGCLPILAQMPVFLILFNVIRGITRRVSDLPFHGIADQAWVVSGGEVDGETFEPDHLESTTDLYQDLSSDTAMDFGPLDLGARAWDILQSDFVQVLPYIALILFVVGSSYYQQRQIQARRAEGAPAINPQQQMIMRVLPLMSGIWSFIFPAGLVLYWATSNAFRVAQQSYITRSIYSKQEPIAPVIEISEDETDEPDVVDEKSSEELSDRERAWAERRAAKAKQAKAKRNPSSSSSRITPKGTKPEDN